MTDAIDGAMAPETTDPETLAALEARITAGLERIARGLAARDARATETEQAPVDDTALQDAQEGREAAEAALAALRDEMSEAIEDAHGQLAEAQAARDEAQAARDEAQAARDTAQSRAAELEAALERAADVMTGETEAAKALSETQEALHQAQSDAADLKSRLHAVEAARRADADEAARALAQAGREAEAAAQTGGDNSALNNELETYRELERVLRRRIQRLREGRNALTQEVTNARDELDEMRGQVESLQARLDDAAAPGAADELVRLRDSNCSLRDTVEELRDVMTAGEDEQTDLVISALTAELESLKAERAVDASDARAILADLRPIIEGEG